MTSQAEGDQLPHPDSPAAQETDAEEAEHWRADAEAAVARSIDINRAMVHRHLRDAATALRLADRAARRLGERDLYDVEFADGRNGEILYVVARNQIDVGLAAIAYVVPKPEREV